MSTKIFIFLVSLVLFTLVGCANGSVKTVASEQKSLNVESHGKELIIFYSYSGQTRRVAEILQKVTDADVYEIRTINSYPSNPHETAIISIEERATGNLPAIQKNSPDLSKYAVIYLGGPIWNSNIATPLASFLAENSLAGKVVKPFWTYQSSDESGCFSDLKARVIGAEKIFVGLGISYPGEISDSALEEKIKLWLRE